MIIGTCIYFLLGLLYETYGEGEAGAKYSGYSLIRIESLKDMTETDAILGLREILETDEEDKRQIIFFDDIILPKRQPIKFIISQEKLQLAEKHLTDSKISYVIVDSDIQRILDDYAALNERQRERYDKFVRDGITIAPNYFLTYDEMKSLLIIWAFRKREIASVTSLGSTTQGRETLGITINAEKSELPAVWIDAGIDSRVWLAPSTALYIAYKILFGQDENSVKLRSNYRWYIIPSINPDGYEYSQNHDRFWRKTRTEYGSCHGVDINRNFDVNTFGTGRNRNPCKDTNCGPEPFSEVESRNLAAAIGNYTSDGSFLMYLSLQSFGQFIFVPWSGQEYLKTEDYDYLWVVAKEGIEAAYKGLVDFIHPNKKFVFGSAPDKKYRVFGSVLDWVKSNQKANYTYSIDMCPSADSEQFPLGISVPPTAIHAGGQQIYLALQAMLDAIEQGPTVNLVELYEQDRRDRGVGSSENHLEKEQVRETHEEF